jgi:hypothetical protein
MGAYRTSQSGSKINHSFGEVVLSCTPAGRLDLLCSSLHREFPALRMQNKRAYWYWRALHWLLLIVTFGGNRTFNDRYSTTIGNLIGWSGAKMKTITEQPDGWEDRVWSTLQHEREHLRQFEKFGVFAMLILYVFVFFPLGLAYFRARFERAGYLRTLRCWYVLNSGWAESAEARAWWIGQFTTGAYGWAFPFPKTVGKWFDDELKSLQAITIPVTFN